MGAKGYGLGLGPALLHPKLTGHVGWSIGSQGQGEEHEDGGGGVGRSQETGWRRANVGQVWLCVNGRQKFCGLSWFLKGTEETQREEEDMGKDKLLRPREVAARLGISRSSVYRWFWEGKLQGIKLLGGPVRILESSVKMQLSEGEFGLS